MSVSDKPATLRAQMKHHEPIICFEPGIAKREGGDNRFVKNKSPTIRANMGDNLPVVCYGECNKRVYISNKTAMTVRAQSHGALPICCFQQNQRDEVWLVGGGGVAGAICANPGMKNQNYLCISVKTKQIDMRIADNEAHPLDVNDDKEPQAVCYAIDHVVLGG